MLLCYFRQILHDYEIVYNEFFQKTKEDRTPENGRDHQYLDAKPLTDEDREQIYRDFVIPVSRLIHVTHLDAAASISNIKYSDSKYVFKSNAKRGRVSATDEHASWVPTGDGRLRQLSEDECIFCHSTDCQCSFIWWSIDTGEWYKTDEGKKYRELVSRLESHGICVADFLHNPPESTYGTQGFSIKFSTLIERYKESRTDNDAEVCFRVATLRYDLEITYIIIMCMGQELPNLNSQRGSESDLSMHRGLLNDSGEVVDLTRTPEFKIKFLIKKIDGDPNKQEEFSWENLVFALYYPNDSQLQLKCEEGDTTTQPVSHFVSTCSCNPCPDYSSHMELQKLLAKHKYCRYICYVDKCKKLNCKHINPACICKF